jgi:hypothetical protein
LILPYRRLSFLLPSGTRIGGAPFASAIPVFGFNISPENKQLITDKVGHVIGLRVGYWSKFRQ